MVAGAGSADTRLGKSSSLSPSSSTVGRKSPGLGMPLPPSIGGPPASMVRGRGLATAARAARALASAATARWSCSVWFDGALMVERY
eukprot:SAG31_NODE_91_length_26366_cov_6.792211_9_plen_87_part_00